MSDGTNTIARVLSEALSRVTALETEIASLRVTVADLKFQATSAKNMLDSQRRWLTSLHELMHHTQGTQSIAIGVAAAGRLASGAAWLESAKRSALAQIPASDDPESADAKTAVIVSDIFDRLEINARSAEGTGGLN